jgi:ketosteroid isomerase-like protein
MGSTENDNLRVIRAYLQAVAGAATGEALARFYTEDALQVELPNRLNPGGGRSDLAALLERAEQVPMLLRQQTFELRSAVAEGPLVAVEAIWSGVLAVPFGTLAPGDSMKAHFAIFFELRAGRICSQRNYDCFEPW